MSHDAPGGLAATRTIATLTWRRLVRGRALAVSVGLALVPVAYALAMARGGWPVLADELLGFELLVLAVLAPMLVASSIGEDIEDRTATYLWSRPVPRWAVLAGKLVALAPLVAVLAVASWGAATWVSGGGWSLVRSSGALAAGAVALSLIATGLATLGPRHGVALTICYLLFVDLPIGVLPVSLRALSASYQVRALSGLAPADAAIGSALLALGLLGAGWATVAALRIRRLEA